MINWFFSILIIVIKRIVVFALLRIYWLWLLVVSHIKILIWWFETLSFYLVPRVNALAYASVWIYLEYLVISFVWVHEIVSNNLLRSDIGKKPILLFSLWYNTIDLILWAFNWFQIKFWHTIRSHYHLFHPHVFLLQA